MAAAVGGKITASAWNAIAGGGVVSRIAASISLVNLTTTSGTLIGAPVTFVSVPFATVLQLEFNGVMTSPGSVSRSLTMMFSASAGTLTQDNPFGTTFPAIGGNYATTFRASVTLPASTALTVQMQAWTSTVSGVPQIGGTLRAVQTLF